MREFKQFLQMAKKSFKCSVIQYPSGRFGFVGNVPDSLCHKKVNGAYQEIMVSNVYETREEAENALNATK